MPERFGQRAGLLAEEHRGRLLLLDSRRELAIELNSTGSLLWRALAPGAGRTELKGRLAAAFPGVDPAGLAEDVERFLETALEAGVVVRQQTGPEDAE